MTLASATPMRRGVYIRMRDDDTSGQTGADGLVACSQVVIVEFVVLSGAPALERREGKDLHLQRRTIKHRSFAPLRTTAYYRQFGNAPRGITRGTVLTQVAQAQRGLRNE